MKNKSVIITFIVSFLVVGSLVAVFMIDRGHKPAPVDIVPSEKSGQKAPTTEHKPLLQPVVEEPQIAPVPAIDFDKVQASSGDLINALTDLLGNPQAEKMVEEMRSHDILDSSLAESLGRVLSSGHAKLAGKDSLREVGSWENGRKVRYEVTFEDGSRGTVDVERNMENKWVVSAINLPTGKVVNVGNDADMEDMADSMAVADAFARAALSSNIKKMRSLVDPSSVNGATLVGLCILFEEGQYSLRKRMPIKGMFGTEKNAGFLAYLSDSSGKSAGNIGMSLKHMDDKGWIVTEISLNSLLDDYVKRSAEGDSIYVPIVKNPKGGDSLALFFGFNESSLTPRSIKQLRIVAEVVKMDDKKKIEINGHTDDVGSDQYNMDLSSRRAEAVKQALIGSDVPAERIVTKAFGKSQPRRTYSTTADDTTREEARRDNRRAEMYLDF